MSSKQRSLSDIEAELDRNRDEMGDTLDALQNKLSSADLFSRGFGYLRSSGSEEFFVNLKHSVQRNPVPVSVLGLGLVWLMVNGSDTARDAIADNTPNVDGRGLRNVASRTGQQTRSTATRAGSGLEQAASSSREGAHKLSRNSKAGMQKISDSTRQGATRVGNAGRHGARRTADGVGYMLQEQPMITAALGLAFGAVVAASLPRTRREDELMGDTRDEFVDYARHAGEEKAQEVRSVADSALDAAGEAAKSEANRQGLAPSQTRQRTEDSAVQRPGSSSSDGASSPGEEASPGGVTNSPRR